MVSATDYMKSPQATPEQIAVLGKILDLIKEEKSLVKKINDAHRPFLEKAEKIRTDLGFNFREIADADIAERVAPEGYCIAAPYQKELDKVRREFRRGVVRAYEELDLSHLPFISINYELVMNNKI